MTEVKPLIPDLRRDGIRAAGCWESYPHRIRAGGYAPEVSEHFEWEQCEAFIEGLAERGFNLFITQFSKGYGIETERPYMERARQLVEIAHHHGIAVGGYLRYSTIIPETLRREIPDCLERFAGRTATGRYARYATQYWRYLPCPCSQEWLDYLDRVIEIGVNEARLDLVHIDGPTLWPEPEACHCPRCEQAFHEYLAARYPEREARLARFGIDELRFIELPDYETAAGFARPRTLGEPVGQEWLLFRCERLTAIWRFLVEAVKRRRPEVWVEGNIKYAPGLNTAWQHGNDLHALQEIPCEGFFTEEANSPELRPNGSVLSYIPTFKKARQAGKTILAYNRAGPPSYREFAGGEELALACAHQLAFNKDAMGCHVVFPTGGFPAVNASYVAFHRERRDLYAAGELVADVGVYYSTRTLAFNFGAPHLAIILAQQALIHERVPFGYLFGEDVASAKRHRVVVLAGIECLSAAEVAALAEYVKAGGGLVVTGAAGVYNEQRRRQTGNRLAEALGISWPVAGGGATARVGRGRVAVLPALLSAGDAPQEAGGKPRDWVEDSARESGFPDEVWRSPRNAPEFLAAVRWAARGFTYDVLAPRGVVCEFTAQPGPRRHLVHLVNFDLGRDAEGIEIRCRHAAAPFTVAAFTPDGAPAEVALLADEEGAVVRLARLHRYAVIVLSATQAGAPARRERPLARRGRAPGRTRESP